MTFSREDDVEEKHQYLVHVGVVDRLNSVHAALRGHRVFTFEALPHNVDRIRSVQKKYGLEDLITVISGAVWDTAGEEKWFKEQVVHPLTCVSELSVAIVSLLLSLRAGSQ